MLNDVYFRMCGKILVGAVGAVGIDNNNFVSKGNGSDTAFYVPYFIVGYNYCRYFLMLPCIQNSKIFLRLLRDKL